MLGDYDTVFCLLLVAQLRAHYRYLLLGASRNLSLLKSSSLKSTSHENTGTQACDLNNFKLLIFTNF